MHDTCSDPVQGVLGGGRKEGRGMEGWRWGADHMVIMAEYSWLAYTEHSISTMDYWII